MGLVAIMENILTAISLIVQPYVLMVICISAIYGLFVGAIPGLTATMATSISTRPDRKSSGTLDRKTGV